MRKHKKNNAVKMRQRRIRKKVRGTDARPRMSVKFSGQHIYVQIIDDEAGRTLASASTRHKNVPDRETLSANVKSAQSIGKLAAEAAKSAGIEQVVFDRGGAKYHGKVKALADAARENGLTF
jgi:large subunit ribosomal protein L18